MARLTTQQRLELELGLRRDVDGDASPDDVSPPPSVLTPMNGNSTMTSHAGVKKPAPPPTAPKPASRSPAVSPGVSPSQFRKAEAGIQGFRSVSFNPAAAPPSSSSSYATPFPVATTTAASSSASSSCPAIAASSSSSLDPDLPLPPPPADLMVPSASDATSGFRINDDFPPPPNNDELFPPPPPPIVAGHSSIPTPAVTPLFGANNNYNSNNAASANNIVNAVNNATHQANKNNSNNNNGAIKSGGFSNSKQRQFQPPTFHGKLQDKEEKSIPLASILTKSLRQNDPSPSSSSSSSLSPTGHLSSPNRPKSPTNHPLSSTNRPKSPTNIQSPAASGANHQIRVTPASPSTTTTPTSTPMQTMPKQENSSGAPSSTSFTINTNGGTPEILHKNNNNNNNNNNGGSYPYKSSNSVNNNNNSNNYRGSPSLDASRPSQSNHSSNEYSPSSVASDKQRRNPSTAGLSASGSSTPVDAFTPKRNSLEIGASSAGQINASSAGQMAASASPSASGQTTVMRGVKPPISPASSQRSSGGSNPSDFTHEAEVDKLTDQLLKGLRATKDPNFYGMCAKCGGEVLGEATGCQAMDNIFHVKCFTCSVCSSQLKGKPFYAMEGKPFCEDCYLNTLEKCSVCSKPITDRILRATGKPYHPACFICVVCGKSLDGIPFTVDATNQIHCIEDFHNKFAPKCHVCGLGIVPEPGETETVRIVALDRSFHVHCYKCEDCGLLLGQVDGEQRPNYPLDGHILCQQCNANRIRQLTSPPVTDL